MIPQIEGPSREVIAEAVAEIGAQDSASTSARPRRASRATSAQSSMPFAIEEPFGAQGVHRAVIELKLQLEPHPETLEHQVEGVAA